MECVDGFKVAHSSESRQFSHSEQRQLKMHVSQQQVGLIVLRPQHSHFLYLPRTVFKNRPPPTSLASFPPLPSPSLPHSFSPPTHPPIQQRVVGTSIKHHPPPTTRA